MDALLLLLLDSRAPAGAHNHSGGVEAAITGGLVRDTGDVERFCRTRLHTAAWVTACFAAAACEGWLAGRDATYWHVLDDELDARTPSEAQRAASRSLGRGLARLLRSVRPETDFAVVGAPAHHPLLLGAGVGACGGTARLAARAAALATCGTATSAAVRLLGLDPFAVQALLARLAPEVDALAARAAGLASTCPPARLPAESAPVLDLLSDVHLTAEVRLFAS